MALRIHHLNCGTSCPWGGRLFDGTSSGLITGHIVCHCLLIETDAGLVLVDTGFGTRDIDHPGQRLARFFRTLNNIQLRPGETALARSGDRASIRRMCAISSSAISISTMPAGSRISRTRPST